MFLQENLIDEIYLSLHPLSLGEGIKLFEKTEKDISLEFIEQKEMGKGLVSLHYKVVKK